MVLYCVIVTVLLCAVVFSVLFWLMCQSRKPKKLGQDIFLEYFEQVIFYNPNWVYIVKSNGTFLCMGPHVEEITGYKSSEFLEDHTLLQRIIHPSDVHVLDQCNHSHLDSTEIHSYEFRLYHKNGTTKWIHHICYPIYANGIKFIGRVGTNTDITQEKLTQENIKNVCSFFQSIAETSLDMICRLDSHGLFKYISPSFVKILGFSENEVIDRFFMDFIYNEDYDYAAHSFKQILAGDSIGNLELRMLKKDKGYIYTEINIGPILNNGKVVEVQGVIRDITEKKIAEKKLIENENKYRRLVENLVNQYFFYVHDNKGVFNYISPSVHQILGYSIDEMCKHYQTYLTDNPINKECEKFTDLSLQGIQQPPYEVEIYHKNGTVKLLKVAEYPVFDSNGTVVAVEGIAKDITATHHAERGLKDQEERFNSLVTNIPGAVYRSVFNEKGRVFRYVGQFFEQITDYTPQDFIKDKEGHLDTIIYKEDLDSVNEIIKNAIEKRENYNIEYRIIHKNGERKWVLDKGRGVYNERGEEIYLDGILFDIHVQKRQEIAGKEVQAQLAHSERLAAIGTLAAGVAHELNNPLNIVSMGVEEFQSSIGDLQSAALAKTLERVTRGIERMTKIISHLKSFSRNKVNEEVIDIHLILENVFILFGKFFVDNKISIVRDFVSNPLYISCDQYQVEQVVVNLLINSKDSFDDDQDKVITIKTREDWGMAIIEICDNGKGIPLDIRNKIFDPFFTTKEIGKGIGLGLYVSKTIVNDHRGEIYLDKSDQNGSCFIVKIPIHKK